MKKIVKNNKGITLVALVITIIILLILAGVSINIVFDEDGIIERAKQAAENMEIAANEEQTQLDNVLDKINSIGKANSYDNPYIPNGFTHTEGTWNNGYTIKDGLGNEFVWVPCVTDESKIKEGDKVELFKKTTDGKYNEKSLGLAPTDTSITDAEPTSAIRKSVATYGGFYIAKYEAGIPIDETGNEIIATSATPTQKARSVSGATVWTGITRDNIIIAAENMINTTDGVKSGLISGECWDTTLKWMVNTSDNASKNVGYDIDSTENGWYDQTDKTTTGKYPVNNIYDMAGNVWKYTSENCLYNGSTYSVCRGGSLGGLGSQYPAAYRTYSNGTSNGSFGFRVVLYKTEPSYDNPYIPTGFAHTEGSWNNGYTIKDELGNEFVWVPCVTDQSKVKEGDKVVTFGKTLPTTTDTTDPYYMYNKSNLTITGEESPANDIKTSVRTYGGFYIAKYEAGVPVDSNNNEIEPTSATVTQKARSVAGANTWTNITRPNAIIASSNMIDSSITGVKSGLISGEAWDTTLQWMVTTSDNVSSNAGYDINSDGKGYYGQTDKTTTGQYAVNNIYDMAGNVYEWTTENCTNSDVSCFVGRGGTYSLSGSGSPAANRNYRNDNSAPSFMAFRVVLYK